MGGPNLEIFKFGDYILFPISMMWYFGTNLDEKFSVPGFWPTKEQSNRVPTDRQELEEEIQRLKTIRLHLRNKRLEGEALARGDFDEVRRLRTLDPTKQNSVRADTTISNSIWWWPHWTRNGSTGEREREG